MLFKDGIESVGKDIQKYQYSSRKLSRRHTLIFFLKYLSCDMCATLVQKGLILHRVALNGLCFKVLHHIFQHVSLLANVEVQW